MPVGSRESVLEKPYARLAGSMRVNIWIACQASARGHERVLGPGVCTAACSILQPSSYFSLSAIEAKLDVDKLLRDTPAEVRAAMLLRYSARGRWNEVGQVVARSGAVRKSCQRRIRLIRERLGVEDAATQNQRTDGSPGKGSREESSLLRERRRE